MDMDELSVNQGMDVNGTVMLGLTAKLCDRRCLSFSYWDSHPYAQLSNKDVNEK